MVGGGSLPEFYRTGFSMGFLPRELPSVSCSFVNRPVNLFARLISVGAIKGWCAVRTLQLPTSEKRLTSQLACFFG